VGIGSLQGRAYRLQSQMTSRLRVEAHHRSGHLCVRLS
jgi:hypothetical protein